MTQLLHFLQAYEIWIYILVGVVGLIYARKLLMAWQEWRSSLFGLERENSQRRLGTSMTIIILLGMMGLVEFSIVSFIAPLYPQVDVIATPTIDLLVTPSGTLTDTGGVGPSVGLSPTLRVPSASGCIKGQIEWIAPKAGESVSGAVQLKYIMNVPNMGFFKYEYSQPGNDTWTTIAAGTKPVTNVSDFDNNPVIWSTNQLVPGDYLLRLVVLDNRNQALPACSINITVLSP
jgi:hypothetical protein